MRLQLATISVVGPLVLLTSGLAALGQPAFQEGFEGPQRTWRRLAGADARHRFVQHARTREAVHSGLGSERISLVSENGVAVFVGHDIGRAPVISELEASVWVRADRPGIQILARVVLPRSQDPRTGQPLSTVVSGPYYTEVGGWQKLRLADVANLVARRARVLRGQLSLPVDEREAYVDQIILNVCGGRGVTNVWIDDLEVAGVIYLPDQKQTPTPAAGGAVNAVTRQAPTTRASVRNMEVQGSVVLVGGRPTLPRIIQYQNEPLATLRQLGFNAVRLSRPPTDELLRDAERVGIWLICPPPEGVGPGRLEIDSRFDSVLAWSTLR